MNLSQKLNKLSAAHPIFAFQANVEGLFEVNGKRYAIESHWRKSLDDIIRHYIYAGKFEIPEVILTLFYIQRFALSMNKFSTIFIREQASNAELYI